MTLLTLFKSSSIITTSLESIVISLPIPPIEIPISAFVKLGASLIPSPIKAVVNLPSFLMISSNLFVLSSGNRLA